MTSSGQKPSVLASAIERAWPAPESSTGRPISTCRPQQGAQLTSAGLRVRSDRGPSGARRLTEPFLSLWF